MSQDIRPNLTDYEMIWVIGVNTTDMLNETTITLSKDNISSSAKQVFFGIRDQGRQLLEK